MRRIYFLILLLAGLSAQAQVEVEPNNDFATANPIATNTARTGTIGSSGDTYDYYQAILPTDGTLKIYVQGTNTGSGSGYLYMVGYDRRRGSGQVFASYVRSTSVAAGATISDTLTVYGRAADTFYFRLETSSVFSYSLRYEMTDTSPNDAEPNGLFSQSVPIAPAEIKQGHIGYRFNGTSDEFDYYRAILPTDGTLKIYVQGRNNDGSSGYLYLYGYDRRQGSGQILASYIRSTSVTAGTSISDTLTVYGRAADTVYFRLESSAPFSYSLRYEMTDTSPNDAEPNNTFATVVPIAYQETKQGHIGYRFNGTSDDLDYYRAILPTDGTLKIYVQGRNNDGNSGYLYLVSYDRRQGSGQILGSYIHSTSTAAGVTISDTLTVYGRAADTVYFRLESSVAFSYSLRYEMADTSVNDAEPNGSFTQTIPIVQGETKQGHIGYRFNGTSDDFDYYKTVFPSDGTLKIYVQGRNNDGNSGYLYLVGYDRRRGSGQVLASYIRSTSTAVGTTISDTLTLQCVAADTFYFRLESSAAFSYQLKYEVTLGVDTTIRVCPGYTTSIAGLYNTTPFSTVKYENLASPGAAISPNNVGMGQYRLSVYNGIECTRDTAIITVAANPKPDLGADVTVQKCMGFATDIRSVKNTTGYAMVEWNTPRPDSVEVGSYQLIVTNTFGCKDTAIIMVANYPQPAAGFNINTTQQCFKGNNFSFTNSSSITSGTLTYQWSFGDNTGTTTANAAHIYAAAGTYAVKLVTTSNNGCRDSITRNVTVNSSPDLGADQTVALTCYGATANLTTLYTTSSYPSVTYSTATPATAQPGVYNLIVATAAGCADTAVITVTALPLAVVPAAGASTRTAARECTDAQGWTHYYNDNGTASNLNDDILVLSIRKNGNNIGTTGSGGFSVKTVATSGAGSNTGVLVTNAALNNFRYWAMNRYWEVTATTQPASAVGVRFYYSQQDLTDIDGSHPANGITPDKLMLYKVGSGPADPTTNLAGASNIIRLTFGSSASTSTFTNTILGGGLQYAEFQVSSFSGGGAGVPDSMRPLPLKLVQFAAMLKGEAVSVDWRTTEEVNVARFAVQRSTDGSRFETIGNVSATGRTASSYAFTDVEALRQGSHQLYYRLQVFDKDGSSYYSPIAAVQLPAQNTFSISPNPATSLVYVKGAGIRQVQVMDNRGRVLLSQRADNSNLLTLSVSQLAKGMYLLKITDSSGYTQTEKLLVQ